MDLLFESGWLEELGEVVGCDPVLYEDTQKQLDFNTSLLTNQVGYQGDVDGSIAALEDTYVGDGCFQAGTGELDSLLAENNQLLDRLMTVNGLQLPTDVSTDLADIDELSAKLDFYQRSIEDDDLLTDIHSLAESDDYPVADSPTSSISTLPSEPSSPIDLVAYLQGESQPCKDVPAPAGELNDLLQSLGDNDNAELAVSPSSHTSYYDECMESPTSEQLYSSSTADESWNDDSVSSYSSDDVVDDSFVGKAKAKKKSKSTPYGKLPAGRKERKKKQNKEAAIRYREKKRKEAHEAMGEEEELAKKNNLLKTEVLNLEREIMCMKELLSDVFNIHSL